MTRVKKTIVSMVLIGTVVATVWGVVRAHRFGYLPSRMRERFSMTWLRSVSVPDPTISQREGWTPDYFFQDTQAIRACEAISAGNQAELLEMIDEGLDVNLTGKAGFDLLHWAFAVDNLEAFKLLLESGSSPDKKLTQFLYLHHHRPLVDGDPIAFTIMRRMSKGSQVQFLAAALEHSQDANVRDLEGKSLLHLAMRHIGGMAATPYIIKAGVDLDAQTEHGDTAAMLALDLNRPQLAQQLYAAGADPNIRNKQSKTVRDSLNSKFHREHLADPRYKGLQEWLEKNSVAPAQDRNSP